MTDLEFNCLFVICILQNEWSVKVKWHFSAFFSLFVPLSIHILIERVLNFALVDAVSENCCTVYCSLLLFGFRCSIFGYHV